MRIFVKLASGLWVGVSTATNWVRGLLSGLVVGIACLFALSFVDFGCVLDTFISKEHRERQAEVEQMAREQAEQSRTYYQRHPEEDPNYIRRDSSLNQMFKSESTKQDIEIDNTKSNTGNSSTTPTDGSK